MKTRLGVKVILDEPRGHFIKSEHYQLRWPDILLQVWVTLKAGGKSSDVFCSTLSPSLTALIGILSFGQWQLKQLMEHKIS